MNAIKSKVNLSWNNKTSCYQFSLPARVSCPGVEERCKNPACVCNFCYACNSLWNMGSAKKFVGHNYQWVLQRNPVGQMLEDFLEAFDKIPKKQARFFRWFGSGDVMTADLGRMILAVAELRPETRFWLPTHNKEFWRLYAQDCPNNLTVSLSEDLMNSPAHEFGTTVVSENTYLPDHFLCPGECKTCRACWGTNAPRIAYPFHGSAITLNKWKAWKKFLTSTSKCAISNSVRNNRKEVI